ncbi:5445_t:CDS:2, partial [Paraglomus brasilianum]
APTRSEPLQSIILIGIMKKWGVDTVGPLPRTQSGNEYSVVAVDYLTKWPEARIQKAKYSRKLIRAISLDDIKYDIDGEPLVVIDQIEDIHKGDEFSRLVDTSEEDN